MSPNNKVEIDYIEIRLPLMCPIRRIFAPLPQLPGQCPADKQSPSNFPGHDQNDVCRSTTCHTSRNQNSENLPRSATCHPHFGFCGRGVLAGVPLVRFGCTTTKTQGENLELQVCDRTHTAAMGVSFNPTEAAFRAASN